MRFSKNIMALAVLGASSAAMAQSTVTIYGIADVWLGSSKATSTVGVTNGVDSESIQSALRQNKLDSGGVAGSRWGIKGSEDLGGGLKANFVLEQGFSIDTGVAATAGFSREATVGISGGFGEVKLGKAYTAYDDIRGTADNTFDANFGSTDLTWVAYNGSAANTLRYTTPDFSGISGAVSYSLGEDKTAEQSASNIFALNIQYKNGPLFVGFAHQTEKSGPNTVLGLITSVNTAVSTTLEAFDATDEFIAEAQIGADAGTKMKYNFLTGSYDFGVAKLVGGYNQGTLTFTDSASVKVKEYQIGVEVPLSANLVLAAGYANSKGKFDGITVTDNDGYSAALLYSLSKRTSIYGAVAQAKNKYSIPLDDVLSAFVENKTEIYAIGVNHKF